MIEHCTGDLFDSGAAAIVVAVNCYGVAGAGQALAAKDRWPEWFKQYRRHCNHGEGMRPGTIHVAWHVHKDVTWAVSLSTKLRWSQPSRVQWVDSGLESLVLWTHRVKPPSIAIPALGCGLGGLAPSVVMPMIEAAARRMPEATRVMIYAPGGKR